MHKLDKYCRRYTDDIVTSDRSRYYKMNNHILRISDHIGQSSSGIFSIIIKDDVYLLHHPTTGSIEILNYEEAKAFVKIFAKFPLGNLVDSRNWEMSKHDKVEKQVVVDSDKTLFGIELQYYTKGERNNIKNAIAQAKVRKKKAGL